MAGVRDDIHPQHARTTLMRGAMAASDVRWYRAAVRYVDKVVPRARLIATVNTAHAAGHRVVFTNGCFDLLHVGHVRYLAAARDAGDLLVVGINDDASVRRLKGPSRPLVSEAARAEVVAALAAVDYVSLFGEDTPLELIQAVQPDVLVKGSDWAVDQVVGRDVVEARGGRVLLIPVVPGFSTTALAERLAHQ
jgi:D-glycero-beta-D-manno-heptose 1-phosphate adenylyltransferase